MILINIKERKSTNTSSAHGSDAPVVIKMSSILADGHTSSKSFQTIIHFRPVLH